MGIFGIFKNAGRRAIFETEAIFSVRQIAGIDPEKMSLHTQGKLTDEILTVLDSICTDGNKYDFTLLYFFFFGHNNSDVIQKLRLHECMVLYLKLHEDEINRSVAKYVASRLQSYANFAQDNN
ncbi:MAG: hypothetical protein ABTQ25_14680 [Nitrosomonas ureae]